MTDGAISYTKEDNLTAHATTKYRILFWDDINKLTPLSKAVYGEISAE